MRFFGYRTGIGRALLGADVGSAERHGITHLALQSCEMLYERAGSVCIGAGNWIVLVSLLVSAVLFASDTSSENVRFWLMLPVT